MAKYGATPGDSGYESSVFGNSMRADRSYPTNAERKEAHADDAITEKQTAPPSRKKTALGAEHRKLRQHSNVLTSNHVETNPIERETPR